MRTLGGLATTFLACGDRTPQAPTTPAPPVAQRHPIAPHHAAPACPLLPLGPIARDENAPHEGIEGEARIENPAHAGDVCAIAGSNLQRVEKAILADRRD